MKSISRRQFLAVVGAAAAVSALSACGSSSSAASTAASTATSAASGAASASGDTIKVGLLAPLTGDVSVYGIAVANGANLYIKQLNEKGGINGKQIEVVEMDEQGDATQAVTCFTQMVDEGITALIGDVTTTPTLAVVAESQDYNMRTTFTDPFQGIKMADYASDKLGFKKAGVIYQLGADYNEGLATNFETEFAANGGEIVASETYSAGDVDFRTQLTTILAAGPDMVYCPNYYEDVGQILSQAADIGLDVPFLGGDGWDGVTQYATADQLDGCYFCANYATGSNPDFESAYEAEYGEPYPNGFSPLGYDAAMTVCGGLQAAEDAGLEAGTDEYKQAVIDGIKNGEFKGVTGTFTFDDHNDPVKTAAILSFENGEAVFVEEY